MALYREKAQLILIKVETTSGVDAVPTAALNSIQSKGVPEIVVDFIESGDRGDVQTGILSAADDAAPAGRYLKFDITVELRGAGAVYSSSVVPPADPLWRMSGLARGSDFTGGSELHRYSTVDTGMETGTVYGYAGGKLFKAVGCVAQPKLATEVLKPGTATFTVTGKLAADPTEVAVPAPTFLQVIPPAFHSVAASLGSWLSSDATNPFMLLSASVDLGTVIAELPSAGAADGLVGYLITDRAPTQDLTFFVPALAGFDPFAIAKLDGSAGALVATYQLGNTQYNRIKIETRWKPRSPKFGNRSGAKTYAVSGPLRVGNPGISTLREIQITYN